MATKFLAFAKLDVCCRGLAATESVFMLGFTRVDTGLLCNAPSFSKAKPFALEATPQPGFLAIFGLAGVAVGLSLSNYMTKVAGTCLLNPPAFQSLALKVQTLCHKVAREVYPFYATLDDGDLAAPATVNVPCHPLKTFCVLRCWQGCWWRSPIHCPLATYWDFSPIRLTLRPVVDPRKEGSFRV